jgi:hypothetical protein
MANKNTAAKRAAINDERYWNKQRGYHRQKEHGSGICYPDSYDSEFDDEDFDYFEPSEYESDSELDYYDKSDFPITPPTPWKPSLHEDFSSATDMMFGTLFLAIHRLENTAGLPLAHQALLEDTLEFWTKRDDLEADAESDYWPYLPRRRGDLQENTSSAAWADLEEDYTANAWGDLAKNSSDAAWGDD